MIRNTLRTLLAATTLLALPMVAQAQVGQESNLASVTLNANRAPSITVTPSVASLTMAAAIVDNSTANSFGSVSITTDYSVHGSGSVVLYGYFGSSTAAMSSVEGNSIPSAWIEGQTSGAWTPFSGSSFTVAGAPHGVNGATMVLNTIALGATGGSASVVTPLALRLNTTGQRVVAGSYTGTLNLRAVVQ